MLGNARAVVRDDLARLLFTRLASSTAHAALLLYCHRQIPLAREELTSDLG